MTRKKKKKSKRTTATRSPSRPKISRDPRLIGAEWDEGLGRWWHPMGDDYLRVALSSDTEFAAAKVAEGIARRQSNAFETLIMHDQVVVRRLQ